MTQPEFAVWCADWQSERVNPKPGENKVSRLKYKSTLCLPPNSLSTIAAFPPPLARQMRVIFASQTVFTAAPFSVYLSVEEL